MQRLLRSPWFPVVLLAVVLALGFLGSRGIWDPDEGRYSNVALNMLASGDWLNPHRNADIGHWTKPPLTYWAIAASVATFGSNPWAARLPAALAYLASVWLTGRIARRFAPGTQLPAAVIYATMLLPLGASQMITTDYVLAACETLAMWAFVEARFPSPTAAGSHHPRAWIALMWAGFALAFMAKGPPGLLPLIAVLAFDLLTPRSTRRRVWQWSGMALFVAMALPWYVAVVRGNPGLLGYFVGNEVVNRVANNEFGRHGEWYGWAQIYLPTLLIGALPWTAAMLRWARTLPATLRRWWREPATRADEASWLLPTLWLLLPLLLFCISRSRMPLYLLPLFAPLAVLVAMQRQREGRALPAWPRLLAWAALLLALKLAAAYWPSHKNAGHWAEQIRARDPDRISRVLFVDDMARYGLHLHLGVGTMIEKITLTPHPQPRFNPSFDESLEQELGEYDPHAIWICKQGLWPAVQARLATLGYAATPLGGLYEGRVIFRVAATGDLIAR